MKTAPLLLLLIALLASYALPAKAQDLLAPFPRNQDGRICYSDTLNASGVSKDELFTRAQIWLASVNVPQGSLPVTDRAGGVMVVAGTITTVWASGVMIPVYSIRLRFYEGKVAYSLTNLNNAIPNGPGMGRQWFRTVEEYLSCTDCGYKKAHEGFSATLADELPRVVKSLRGAILQPN